MEKVDVHGFDSNGQEIILLHEACTSIRGR